MSDFGSLVQDPNLKQILQLLKNGNLDAARQQCYSILLQDNQNSYVLFLLGVIAEKKGEFEGAVKYLKKSIISNSSPLSFFHATINIAFVDVISLVLLQVTHHDSDMPSYLLVRDSVAVTRKQHHLSPTHAHL